MVKYSFLALFSFLVSCTPMARMGFRAHANVQDLATVRINMLCVQPSGKVAAWSGSGVIISKHEILTAYHVMKCPGPSIIVATDGDGYGYSISLSVFAEDFDIAKATSSEELPFVRHFDFGPRPKKGEGLCTDSASPSRARKCGWVTDLREDSSNMDIEHTAQTISGNSGSGCYDLLGRLVGIATMAYNDGSKSYCASLWDHREIFAPTE